MEKRSFTRRRVFKVEVIQASGPGMKCTVRNLSETGAAVVADDTVPDEFTLVVVSENLIKKCKVVWREKNRMGLAFV